VDLFSAGLETPRGLFTVLFHRDGIYELLFPGSFSGREYPNGSLPWPGLQADLNRYFMGEQVSWDPYPLDMSGYTPFVFKLLQVVRQIPYGSVCTYRDAAALAGSPRAWRAAGQALSVNRHPLLVPCHRVIRSDGRFGGFSGPPGWKEDLLKLEAPDYSGYCKDGGV